MEKLSDLEIVEYRLYRVDGNGMYLLDTAKTLQPLVLQCIGVCRDIIGVLSNGDRIYIGHINLL